MTINSSCNYGTYSFSDTKANSSDDEEAPLLVSKTQEKMTDFSKTSFQKSEPLLSLEGNNQKQKIMQATKERVNRDFLLDRFTYERPLVEQLRRLCESERYEDFLYLDSVCAARNLLIIGKIFRKIFIEKDKGGSNEKFMTPNIYKLCSTEEILKASTAILDLCKSNQANLSELSYLDLTGKNLSELPVGIFEFLPNLVKLDISYNELVSMPTEIKNLKNLEILECTHNHLNEWPEALLALKNLQKLNLTKNKISTIPDGISKLKRLRSINLFENKLTFISKEIGQLENLEKLALGCNHLTEVPCELAKLKKLKVLDLGNNQLSTIPLEIRQMELTYFDDSLNGANVLLKEATVFFKTLISG